MPFLAVRRSLVLAWVVGAALVIGAPAARGQGPARTEGEAIQPAVAFDVSLEHHGEQVRVVVLLDHAVDVVEQAGPARVVYRMVGARAGGRRRPVVAPDDDGPVVRVGLMPAGRDLDLVIEVRRTAAVKHRLVEVRDGFELRVDIGDGLGRRPPAPVATKPPAAAPPRPKALPTAGPPAAVPAPREARRADAPRTLGGHTFLTPARGPSPFVTTHLGLSIGFEHARFPGIDRRDRTRYPATLGALSLRLELGVRILPRLGLIAAGGGLLASGFDGQSALDLGAGGGGFWLVGIEGTAARIAETGTQVGARLSVEGSAGGNITSIARLFDQAATTRQAPSTSDLFASESSYTGRFAWAPRRPSALTPRRRRGSAGAPRGPPPAPVAPSTPST